MITKNDIERIESNNYEVIRFSSGLKNFVGELVFDNKPKNVVIKQFESLNYKKTFDYYEAEKRMYLNREKNTMVNLLYFDDVRRFLLLEKFKGTDLYVNEIKSSESLINLKTSVIDSLLTFQNHFSNVPDIDLRKIDIENYLRDGLEKLIGFGFVSESTPLLDSAEFLSKIIASDTSRINSHGSLNPGNILHSNYEIKFIDFELAGSAVEFYDISFLLSRTSLKSKNNREIADYYLDRKGINTRVNLEKIDLYRLANIVLLLGLDYETIRSKNNSEVFTKRFYTNISQLSEQITSYEPISKFSEKFREALRK